MAIQKIPTDMVIDRVSGQKLSEQLADIATNVKKFGATGDGVNDDTVAIQNAINSANGQAVLIPKGRFKITQTLILPTGMQLVGSSKKGSVLTASTDITMLKNVGGESITISNLKIENTTAGARTNFDVVLTNVANPKVINVECYFPNNPTGNAGILIDKVVGQPNENSAFMPQIIDSWVRNGRIKIDKVSDCKIQGCWIWAHLTEKNAIELNGGGNVTIENCDIVPSRFAGIEVTGGLSQLTVTNSFIDGSYNEIYTGWGIKSIATIRSFAITNNKFWQISEGGINLTDARGGSIVGNQFRHNNKADNFFSDIKLTNCLYNTFTGNTFIQALVRTNKGYLYDEDVASLHNVFVSNVLENENHYYNTSLVRVNSTTTVGLNKPDSLNPSVLSANVSTSLVDTLTKPGVYYLNNGTSSGTPGNRIGFLEVLPLTNNENYVIQRFITFNTGTNITYYRKRENGTWATWQIIANTLSGTTANRPTYREVGMSYFDTTLNKRVDWNGTVWVDSTGTTV